MKPMFKERWFLNLVLIKLYLMINVEFFAKLVFFKGPINITVKSI